MTDAQEEGKKTFLGLLEGPLGSTLEFEYEYGASVSELVRVARELWESKLTQRGSQIKLNCVILLHKNEKGAYTQLKESEPIPLPVLGDTYKEKYSIGLIAAFEAPGA